MSVWPIFVLLAALASAQTDLPRELVDLAKIKARVRANLDRLPRYTCLETIERSHRAAGKREFRPVDTLRIEVTRIGNNENYSWPGARRFEESAGDVVRSGTISTGEFSAHAFNAVLNPASQIRYSGEETYKGRRVLKYDYGISTFASGWTLTFASQSAAVGQQGSFWADAESLDLLRLDSQADGIPAGFPMTAVSSQTDYAKVRLGGIDVLLPQSARLLADERDGERLNHVEFSQCREYLAESSIRFDDAPPAEPPAASVGELALAPGISLSLELTQPIDSNSAIEGDAIEARISADAKLKGQVIVPKGAHVRGRIRRMERYSDPVPHFIVGLEFIEIDVPDKRWIFRGSLEQIDPVPGLSWFLQHRQIRGDQAQSVRAGWTARVDLVELQRRDRLHWRSARFRDLLYARFPFPLAGRHAHDVAHF